jgi:hypothetical protein
MARVGSGRGRDVILLAGSVKGWRNHPWWAEFALWGLLVLIVVALAVAGWWSARNGNGS